MAKIRSFMPSIRRQLVPKNVRWRYFEFPSRVDSCKGAFEQADVLATKVVVLGSGSTTNMKWFLIAAGGWAVRYHVNFEGASGLELVPCFRGLGRCIAHPSPFFRVLSLCWPTGAAVCHGYCLKVSTSSSSPQFIDSTCSSSPGAFWDATAVLLRVRPPIVTLGCGGPEFPCLRLGPASLCPIPLSLPCLYLFNFFLWFSFLATFPFIPCSYFPFSNVFASFLWGPLLGS